VKGEFAVKTPIVTSLGLWVMAVALLPVTAHAKSCESLAQGASPAVSVVEAKTISAGDFAAEGSAQVIAALPAFCRVVAVLKPTADSDIRAEIWLPVSHWNGKLVAVGSGGWGGSIAFSYGNMADALRRGYAASATDDGHSGGGASFIVGHPEKFVDFAYRAEHEMTLEAKRLIKTFYGSDALHSYWNGCSGGGREGLLQAARYPDEFDGVIAGDPANVRRNAWALWLANQTFKDADALIPPAKYPMIHRAVLEACDARDGLKDGLIDEPTLCHIDFKSLECKSSDGPDCLTPRQVQSAQTILTPASTPRGEVLFPRLEPGTEMRWARLAGGPNPGELFLDQFRYLVYQDPNWDWRTFDLVRDAARANAINKGIDELDPRLAAFAKHGGKLLIYHGWADEQVAPGSSIEFYKTVLNVSSKAGPPVVPKVGRGAAGPPDWIRLFMIPGMGHCQGGEGPDTFDKLSVIEQWVEEGKAPDRIIAAHRTGDQVDRTRPLCPYPQVARYIGVGSVDDAANFTCKLP
jgi:feruloyl esterase